MAITITKASDHSLFVVLPSCAGGKPCTNLAVAVAHSKLTCTIPSGGGRGVSVAVRRGSQVASEGWLDYNGRRVLGLWGLLVLVSVGLSCH